MSAASSRVLERSAAIAQATPAWKPWTSRLTRAFAASLPAPRVRTSSGFGDRTTPGTPPARAANAPILDGAEIALSARATRKWLSRCFARSIAKEHGERLLELAVRGDRGSIEAVAVLADVDGPELAADAFAAALPVLHAVRAQVVTKDHGSWASGSCPVCGAWPALAESRGLERTRQLRCGRCGSDWAYPWLRCVHCGEADHRKQGSLVPEAGGEARRVETCLTCRGYVKTIATLSAIDPEVVPFDDLANVDLDVVALERGFALPLQRPLTCRVVLEDAS